MNLFRSISSWFALSLLIVGGVAARAANDAREASQLSEPERLRYELLVVRSQLHAALTERDACRVQLAPVRMRTDTEALKVAVQELKAAVEQAHPGHTFDPATGTLAPTPPQAETEKRP